LGGCGQWQGKASSEDDMFHTLNIERANRSLNSKRDV
jgi:hypothetical protein